MTLHIVRVADERQLDTIRELFREYAQALPIDLAFQGFAEELAALPGRYAAPGGALLLAQDGFGQPLGCVGLRPLEIAGACEIKRLYIRAAGRGSGAGRALAQAILACAVEAGYREAMLDTLPGMTAAIGLYRSLGFEPIEPYWTNDVPDLLYFGRRLP